MRHFHNSEKFWSHLRPNKGNSSNAPAGGHPSPRSRPRQEALAERITPWSEVRNLVSRSPFRFQGMAPNLAPDGLAQDGMERDHKASGSLGSRTKADVW